MNACIFDPAVEKLLTLVEEGARASSSSVLRFIEPERGTLRRALSNRHHLVFGRRGSGKSSLLYKSADTLSKKGIAVAYVDLEPFKGHHYPDVLISVLLASLEEFRKWINEFRPGKRKRAWYLLWFGMRPNNEEVLREDLLKQLNKEIVDLNEQLYSTDSSSIVASSTNFNERKESSRVQGTAGVDVKAASARLDGSTASEFKNSEKREISEQFKRSKIDYLHRKILDYQKVFSSLSGLSEQTCFLFLDDLYHIARRDQSRLLDYFHRIVKGNRTWLKVGTIKHRTTWYVHDPQPTGLKIGDDADVINLDLTLEKFSTSKKFLSEVLDTYITEAEAPNRDELLSDGALDRLVIASGGVTRDFLGIFRRTVDEARERLIKKPNHPRGTKISAEDVNMASGSYGETKREEFEKDTLDDMNRLYDAFKRVSRFCLETTKTNVFLLDQNATDEHSGLLQELIDLRLIHHVRSRVTISARPGKVFRALMLDLSQYTGERIKRDIEMMEFWKDDRQILRKVRLIYDPSIPEEPFSEAMPVGGPKRKAANVSDGSQGSLDLRDE